MSHERHLTLSESSDFFGDWTPDSKSIVFWSNRDGQNDIAGFLKVANAMLDQGLV